MNGKLSVVEYLLSLGVDRSWKITEGENEGKIALEMAGTDAVRILLKNYEKRLCLITCDELGKKYITNVFNHLAPQMMKLL